VIKSFLIVVAAATVVVAIDVSAANAQHVRDRYHYANLTPGASDHTDYDWPYSVALDGWCSAIDYNEMYMQYTYYNGTVALIKTSGSWGQGFTGAGGHIWVYEANYQNYRKKAYCQNPSIVTYWANCYFEYWTNPHEGCPLPA